MARMTTIGQTNPDDAALAPGSTTLPLTAKEPAWTSAGTQNWPPKQAKVVADGVTQDRETDTIDLAKLPPLTLTLNPSTDQNVRPGSTVKYSAKVSGDTTGLTLQYGWYHLNALKVTGDSLYGASPAGT
jgi:hypothetical protein